MSDQPRPLTPEQLRVISYLAGLSSTTRLEPEELEAIKASMPILRKLVPPKKAVKREVVDHLYQGLVHCGVAKREPGYWKGYAGGTLRNHFPKFSEWYWLPKK